METGWEHARKRLASRTRQEIDARLRDLILALPDVVEEGGERQLCALAARAAGAHDAALFDDTPEGEAPPADSLAVMWVPVAGRRMRFRFSEPAEARLDRPALAAEVAARRRAVLARLDRANAVAARRAEEAFLAQAGLVLLTPLGADGVEEVLRDLVVPHLVDWLLLDSARPPAGFATERGPNEPTNGVRLGFALECRGRAVGSLAAGRYRGVFTATDVALLERLTDRVALALDNARLLADNSDTSIRLQRSLLPPGLLPVPGLDLASRYVAAAAGQTAGGDFFDSIRLPGGGATLIVGDVQGKGIDAATLTSLARHTLRAAALDGAGPAEMLRQLNAALLYGQAEQVVAGTDPVARFVTAAVVALTPTPGGSGFDAVVACGGQPPPLALRADGKVEFFSPRGMLLGVSERPTFEEERTALCEADTLVLYTDGVTEQQRGEEVFSEAQLGRLVRNRLAAVDADEIAALICETVLLVAGAEPRDDVAILVACVTGRP